ncbi:protein BPS1, chloroplastic-like [Argentina anserina]|uniref:protein BPS1, chloroplastic-like n=1 Tax=Argentina anserina TaxID=57926 RepID=UPI002176344D|nr:protein BPS1, chloroplastic-like [Potentilla anserina]
MVLLLQKIDKLYSKLENYHHSHQSQALSSSLEAFHTLVCSSLNSFLSTSRSAGSEVPSFPWIQQCFELIPIINNGFAKLVVAVDYPMTEWEGDSVEEYLRYTLKLLELCNSITCSLSHLGKERLSLSHGLSLVENSSPCLAVEHLRQIQVQPKSLSKDFRFQGNEEHGSREPFTTKKSVIHQALVVMEGMVFWVCGILMSSLVGNTKPYMEMRHSGGRLVSSLLAGLDLSVGEVIVENHGMLKEVKDINDSVAGLVSAIQIGRKSKAEAEELQRRLEMFEKMVEGLGKEVACLFNKVLAGRNQLLNGFQHQKH